ncbi:Gfo/Idh/MocA family protein [Ruegeria arenilitoris]|uniref:Gfo/Idh/MocA family protein n=1 Tax=Ruegeria arenilitoris TaxID=1173585 RepID=UPI00147B0E5D|nr:Gfo/Idh/MocA family oxidoreductase [Ruegeria arenilitoris]
MTDKINIAVVGLGKMGLSHYAIANVHPMANAVACDDSRFISDVLKKNAQVTIHSDYAKMLATQDLDAVVIATPSRLHASMASAALEKGLHVFCEKPFCLNWQDSLRLAELAKDKGVVTQVGYHYRYVGAFQEVRRILNSGALGNITHVQAEAYGPVVLRHRRSTWRTDNSEGGGCLYDYAAHPLNLLNWYFGTPTQVSGSFLTRVFSEDADDQVMSTLRWDNGATAQLSVNWSDESHRKMSTKITMIGTNGRLFADRQECQLYLRNADPELPTYTKGWNVRYTTELTDDVWFYLRGEEYSAQLDGFITAVAQGKPDLILNDFASATETDKTMSMILANADTGMPVGEAPIVTQPAPAKRRGWFRL